MRFEEGEYYCYINRYTKELKAIVKISNGRAFILITYDERSWTRGHHYVIPNDGFDEERKREFFGDTEIRKPTETEMQLAIEAQI